MASCVKTQYFLKPMLLLPLLAQVLVMTWHSSVTEAKSPEAIYLTGELGGNVTFQCSIEKDKPLHFFYLQRGDVFVNGYHSSMTIDKIWENTELNYNKTAVDMFNLNVSHGGKYECHIQYEPDRKTVTRPIHLSLTGKYSKPEVAKHCDDKSLSCVVMCSSRGGYPEAKMTWSEDGRSCQMCKVVNSSEMEDPDTKTYSSSSTVHYNCTSGKPSSLSCSVGNVTSDEFLVCTSAPVSYVIRAAICVVVFITIMVACLLWWKCKTRRTTAALETCPDEVITMVTTVENSRGEDGS